MEDLPLEGKLVLVTGAGRRIGRALALASARAGADVVIHYNQSEEDASKTKHDVEAIGRRAWTLRADFCSAGDLSRLIRQSAECGPLFGLVNNAAIFEARTMDSTQLSDWERHLSVNLSAPFLLTQAFARQVPEDGQGRVVNILDWRAMQPGADHFPYTVSKAALAAMTRSLALAVAPRITVNGLALGAILPPADAPAADDVIRTVPAERWGQLEEVAQALMFLLSGPAYVTGEIIHVDGGRHLI